MRPQEELDEAGETVGAALLTHVVTKILSYKSRKKMDGWMDELLSAESFKV